MSLFVLDASVAVKWFLPAISETLTDEALTWLARYAKKEVNFLVPDLFWVECASVAWKAIRRGRLTKVSADAALTALTQYDFPTIPAVNMLRKAFEIATKYERTVHDGIYVALAVQSNSQLITADEKLADSLAARFPVKWLGSM